MIILAANRYFLTSRKVLATIKTFNYVYVYDLDFFISLFGNIVMSVDFQVKNKPICIHLTIDNKHPLVNCLNQL